MTMLPSWAPRYLSYSAASTVDQCPRRWVYRYRDKIKGTPKRHLLFGTYVHAVCEHSARDGIHEPAALKELARRLFNEEVTPSDDWCYLWPDETEFRREAWQHIVRVKRAEQAGWLGEPRWLEMKLDLKLNGVPFFGFIDRVDVENEIIIVCDYKTGKVDSYLAPRASSPQLQAKMEKERHKKLYQNCIYGAALARTSDLPIGDGRFVFTSTDPVTIVPSPKSLEGEALDWLAGCWDKVQEAAKLGDDAKACTGPLCSWCDAVDVCPEGRKHVAWMLTSTKQDGSPHKVSDDTLAMLKITPDLQEWVKFGRQPGVVPVEINACMEVRRPDPFRARPDEPPLDEPSVGELRGWLMEATQSQRPNVERIRHLERVLRRRGFEVERWEPSEAQLAPPKPKRRRKAQTTTAKAKAKTRKATK